jgi:eukaryotic-like serine/threonine-protein kinase
VTGNRDFDESGLRCVAGRYQLRSELGRGGMGTVWLAEDTLLRRDVAVKEVTLPPTVSTAERAMLRERTLREARAAARLNHPAAITVYDVVEEDGHPYIVMELARSRTLAEEIKRVGPLPPKRVAEIGLAVLGALEAAHAVGIVHRDVKPANVLLRDDGRVTLTDFGIAMSSGDPSITSTGVVLGSPSYISPERARGAEPGPHSDLWSLAATMYCAVQGRPPFDRGDAVSTLAAVVSDEPDPVHAVDGPFAALLADMLAKDPARRPAPDRVRGVLTAVAAGRDLPQAPRPPAAAVDAGAHTTVLPIDGVGASQPDRPTDAGAFRRRRPRPRPVDARQSTGPVPSRPPRAGPMVAAGRSGGTAVAAATEAATDRPVTAVASSRTGRRLPLAAAAAIVLLTATLITVAVVRSRTPRSGAVVTPPAGTGPAAAGAPRASTSASGGSSPPAPSTAKSPGPSPPAGVPADWRPYRDPAGWSLAHPPGWTVSSRAVAGQGTLTDFTDPTTGRLLRVDRTEQPQPTPERDWLGFEPQFAAANPGYARVRLKPVTYKNGWPAADWEFTYAKGSATLHALDREAFTDKGVYALYFQTPADQWAASQPQLAAFHASFQPG